MLLGQGVDAETGEEKNVKKAKSQKDDEEPEDEDEDVDEKQKVEDRDATPQFRSKSVSLRGATEAEKPPQAKTPPFFLPHSDASGAISLDDLLKANGI